MNYMLLIYGAESGWSEAERKDCMEKSMAICNNLAKQGKFIAASPLQPVETAVTVRRRNGKPEVTQGPFTETTEQLGGFYILPLENLDDAIAVAASLPPATRGTVEIRPIRPLEGLPERRAITPRTNGDTRTPFMLLSYDDFSAWETAGEDAMSGAMQEAAQLTRQLAQSGQYIDASPLYGPETATCLRVRNGRQVITDGPFTETNEILGGYYVVLTQNRDEAIEIAKRHPGMRFGSVEVRPLEQIPEFRYEG
jgi:hypothetical protein